MKGFQINLKEFLLGDVLQFISRVKKTGVLKVSGDISGDIYIKEGLVVHAADGVDTGMEALLNLSFINLESCVFEPAVEAPQHTINEDFGKLTEDIEKRRIEYHEVKKKLPPMETILKKSTKDLEAAVALRRTDWQILALIDGKRTLGDVITQSKVGGYEATKTVTWLKDQGLIYDPRETERVMRTLTLFLKILFEDFGKNALGWLQAWAAADAENKKVADAVHVHTETLEIETVGQLNPDQIMTALDRLTAFIQTRGPKTYGKVLFKKKWQQFVRRTEKP
jgi:hypothetical protein